MFLKRTLNSNISLTLELHGHLSHVCVHSFFLRKIMWRLYFLFKFIYTANPHFLALLEIQNIHAGIAIEQN